MHEIVVLNVDLSLPRNHLKGLTYAVVVYICSVLLEQLDEDDLNHHWAFYQWKKSLLEFFLQKQDMIDVKSFLWSRKCANIFDSHLHLGVYGNILITLRIESV